MPVRVRALAWRAISLLPGGGPVGAFTAAGLAYWGLGWPPYAALALAAAVLGWDLLIMRASVYAAQAHAEAAGEASTAGELPATDDPDALDPDALDNVRRLPAPRTFDHDDH